jgi:CO/xanthine dehydrogenase Mo-binding subunit
MTAMARLAAEVLDLDESDVRVSWPDTDKTPFDHATHSSRSTYAMGSAVTTAVEDVRSQVLCEAAKLLEASPDELEVVRSGVRVKGVPSRCLPLGEVVLRSRSGQLIGNGRYTSEGGLDPETGQGIASVHWHQAAGAAEVEVDLDTGKVEVLNYHASVYAGRVINPTLAELQTEGNVAWGIGQTLFEEMVFDGGQLKNGNLGDYMITGMMDLPHKLSLTHLENSSGDVIHGLGETALPPVMAAIGNAVFQATGVRIMDLPITPERVLRALNPNEA